MDTYLIVDVAENAVGFNPAEAADIQDAWSKIDKFYRNPVPNNAFRFSNPTHQSAKNVPDAAHWLVIYNAGNVNTKMYQTLARSTCV
jgi:hypothetical protein